MEVTYAKIRLRMGGLHRCLNSLLRASPLRSRRGVLHQAFTLAVTVVGEQCLHILFQNHMLYFLAWVSLRVRAVRMPEASYIDISLPSTRVQQNCRLLSVSLSRRP